MYNYGQLDEDFEKNGGENLNRETLSKTFEDNKKITETKILKKENFFESAASL